MLREREQLKLGGNYVQNFKMALWGFYYYY